jgi:hypothetical protein
VTLGRGNFKSQSTTVPENGAYILAEDQNGVGAQFGASKNYFDYGGGTKNAIATTSENFVTAEGYFSTAEQGSLVSQQLTGVCNSSSGCTGSYGNLTSIGTYRLYPLSNADIVNRTTQEDGEFFTSAGSVAQGAVVATTNPNTVWTRSNDLGNPDNNKTYAGHTTASGGVWNRSVVTAAYGFRPAGVF